MDVVLGINITKRFVLKLFFCIFAEDLEILKRIIVQLNNRDYD